MSNSNFWIEEGGIIILVLSVMLFFGILWVYRKKHMASKEHLVGKSLIPMFKNKQESDIKFAISSGEKSCKEIMKEIFGKDFVKQRPDFLKNTVTGYNLELDCYNEELKIAVEYNGRQHYEFVPYFHKNKEAFMNQKYRDDMKRRLCMENGVRLIEVPYTISRDKIKPYIETILDNMGIFRKK